MHSIPLLLLAAVSGPAAGSEEDPQRQEIVVTGVRDEASEGTDSYTTGTSRTSTRLPLTPRETPQSVSVVTRTQIDDFGLRDVNTLLTTTTGINVQQTETDRTYFSARGFDITNFQIDGIGLPFANGLQNGSIDTATFDRVEVLRGANGLLSSTGNPSATINLVRKRPGREFAASASLLYGSFDQIRADADVSVPLTANGAIRARVVGAWEDKDSYLDRYHSERAIGYGVVEADLGPATTLSLGYQHQQHNTDGGMWGALPLYDSAGNPLDLPRSANTSADWSKWDIRDQQIFGDLTHDLGQGWTAKLSVLRRVITEDEELFYVYGNPDPVTGDGLFSYPGAFQGPTRELTVDAYVSGPFELFGRSHELVLGANYGVSDTRQYASYDYSQVGLPLPGNSAFDGSFPRPDFPDFELRADFTVKRETAYGLFRINPADGVKLMLGGNITHIRSEGQSYDAPREYSMTRGLPFVGATVDLTSSISAYASFATIFNPQTEVDETLRVLPPTEGDNLEAGLKGEWFGGKLNASASIFRAHQRNIAESVGFDTGSGLTLYRGIDATAEGVELDVGGMVLPGLQLSGGYTLLRIEGPDGNAVRTYVPRHTGRFNLAYAPPAIPQLRLGASVQYQSRIWREQPLVIAGTPVITEQKEYALVDLMARFEIDKHWSLTANLRNLTDVKPITSLYWEQGFFGPPRTVSATLGWRF
ncbi:MAG TPA: TonB-dependent siderophore receptor [Sphingomonas sp.]|nr:TonB-dependent siderophore receptor [Sphingomonas sp.]